MGLGGVVGHIQIRIRHGGFEGGFYRRLPCRLEDLAFPEQHGHCGRADLSDIRNVVGKALHYARQGQRRTLGGIVCRIVELPMMISFSCCSYVGTSRTQTEALKWFSCMFYCDFFD